MPQAAGLVQLGAGGAGDAQGIGERDHRVVVVVHHQQRLGQAGRQAVFLAVIGR